MSSGQRSSPATHGGGGGGGGLTEETQQVVDAVHLGGGDGGLLPHVGGHDLPGEDAVRQVLLPAMHLAHGAQRLRPRCRPAPQAPGLEGAVVGGGGGRKLNLRIRVLFHFDGEGLLVEASPPQRPWGQLGPSGSILKLPHRERGSDLNLQQS